MASLQKAGAVLLVSGLMGVIWMVYAKSEELRIPDIPSVYPEHPENSHESHPEVDVHSRGLTVVTPDELLDRDDSSSAKELESNLTCLPSDLLTQSIACNLSLKDLQKVRQTCRHLNSLVKLYFMLETIQKQITSISIEIRMGDKKGGPKLEVLFDMLKTGDPASDFELQMILDEILRKYDFCLPYSINPERWTSLKGSLIKDSYYFYNYSVILDRIFSHFDMETLNKITLSPRLNHEKIIVQYLFEDDFRFERLYSIASLSNLSVTPVFKGLMGNVEITEGEVTFESVILAVALLHKYGEGTDAFKEHFQLCIDLFERYKDEQSRSTECLINMIITVKAHISIVKGIIERVIETGGTIDRSKLVLALLVFPEYQEIYKMLGPSKSFASKFYLQMKIKFWPTPEAFSDAIMNGLELEHYEKSMDANLIGAILLKGNKLKYANNSGDLILKNYLCSCSLFFLSALLFITTDLGDICLFTGLNSLATAAKAAYFLRYYQPSVPHRSFEENKSWLHHVFKNKMDPKNAAKTMLLSDLHVKAVTDEVMVELIRMYFQITESSDAKQIYSKRFIQVRETLLYCPFLFFNSVVEYFKLIIVHQKPNQHLIGTDTTKEFDYVAKWVLNNVISPEQIRIYKAGTDVDPLVLKYLE